MKQLFKIDESEMKRILEMHENATKKNYLSEQETTLRQQPSGPEINGKTYKIDNIKNVESLNQFLNWGITNPQNSEITKNREELSFKSNDYMSKVLGLGPVSDLTSTEEIKSKVESVYNDLDNIAQNYTLAQLCGNETVEGYTPTNPKSLEIARVRVKSVLGWCGKTQTQLDREAKAQSKDTQQLNQERGKF
jgi:hypothetical protein